MARGSVYKRHGNWVIQYDAGVRWDEKKGKYVRRQKKERVPDKKNREGKLVPPNKKDAESLLSARLAEVSRGEFSELSRQLFGEFVDEWVEKYASGHVEDSTAQRYESYMRSNIKPMLGHIPLSDITVEHIQEFKTALLGRGLTAGYVKIQMALVRQILGHAVSWGRLRVNHAKAVTFPRIPKSETEFWEPHEFRAILATIPEKFPDPDTTLKWEAFFMFGVTGCLRIGEVFAAKWKYVDWEGGRYSVQQTWRRPRKDAPAEIVSPKTDSSIGAVYLSPKTMELLQRWKQACPENALGLIFPSENGGPLDYHNFCNRVFRPLVKLAKVTPVGTHGAFRHTGATLMISRNESPKYIQRQLRHSSIRMTYDVYGHLFKDVFTEAPSRMDETLFQVNENDPDAVEETGNETVTKR